MKEMLRKWIADYQHYMATIGSWESKKTIEEKLAARRGVVDIARRRSHTKERSYLTFQVRSSFRLFL